MNVRMKVKLIKDLTKYDPHLVIGAVGTAYMERVTYSDWEEPLYEVKIEGAYPLPIGMNALEILDKGYWKERERDIKQAVRIEYHVGPRGGFKFMRIWSKDRKGNERIFTTTTKHEAEKLKEMANLLDKTISKKISR